MTEEEKEMTEEEVAEKNCWLLIEELQRLSRSAEHNRMLYEAEHMMSNSGEHKYHRTAMTLDDLACHTEISHEFCLN